jgi:hypothetical protein
MVMGVKKGTQGYNFHGEKAQMLRRRMAAMRASKGLMRPEAECTAIANRILAQLDGHEELSRVEIFAELLAGGPESDWSLSPNEASRFLGKRQEYGRNLLQRLHKRVFGSDLGTDARKGWGVE